MKRILLSLAISTAASLPAASALAADLDAPPPPVEDLRPATYDWTGPYAGISASVISEEGHYITTCPPTQTCTAPPAYDPEMSGTGYAFDVHAGWNYQIDQIVLGVEGNWAFGGKIGQNREPYERTELGFNHIAQLRARLGVAFDDTLVYALGGAAFVNAEFSSDDYPYQSNYSASDKKWVTGFVVGGGIEHAFTDRISARLEYTYMGLPDTEFALYNPVYGTATVNHDFEGVHAVTLGVSYNFGW
jgi:outer membrane immunogenic protein